MNDIELRRLERCKRCSEHTEDDGVPVVKFCPNCGQKIDWDIDSKK